MDSSLSFNRSLKFKSEPLQITADAGAVTVREILERSGVVDRIAARIDDPRQPGKITHSMRECLRALLVLAAQGRRDHNDADAYRNDPAFALAVCDRKGTVAAHRSLPSQPTLSRFVALLSSEENRKVLREELAKFVKWRLRAIGGGRLHRRLTVDVDGLPIDVHGNQPGGEWNGCSYVRQGSSFASSLSSAGTASSRRPSAAGQPPRSATRRTALKGVGGTRRSARRHSCRATRVYAPGRTELPKPDAR